LISCTRRKGIEKMLRTFNWFCTCIDIKLTAEKIVFLTNSLDNFEGGF